MKKKIIIVVALIAALGSLAYFLLCPTKLTLVLNDGGTEVYDAPLCRMINWNKITEKGNYIKTSYYFYPDNQKTPDELWEIEKANIK